MDDTYKRVNWEDSPSIQTPISARNLNIMDKGIEEAHVKVVKIEANKIDKPSSGKVGQVLVVESVDGNGKPTSFKLVDMEESGNGSRNGVTVAQASSLWAILQKTALTEQLTQSELSAFKTAWGITEDGASDGPDTGDSPGTTGKIVLGEATNCVAIAWISGVPATSMLVEYADWSLSDISNAFINGVRYKLEPKDGYIELRHAWKEGDVITLNLTQQLDVNFIGDNREYVAFSYGPVLLGADIGSYGLYYDDFFGTNKMEPSEKIGVESNVPMFYVSPSLIKKGVVKQAGEDAKFTVGTTVITEKVDLLPWYDIRFTRSAVLFRRYDSREEADGIRSRAAVTTN